VEYNRSASTVLCNAKDVASRPFRKKSWAGKPGAVVSVSISALVAFGANHILRQSMVYGDVPMKQKTKASVGNAHNYSMNQAIR
jgi:chromate reductase